MRAGPWYTGPWYNGSHSREACASATAEAVGTRQGAGWGLPVFAVIIGSFMSILDSTIVNVAIPTLQSTFGASTDQVQWVVTIFLLALGIVVPVSGWLADRYGMTRVYIASLIIFTAGSALCGLSTSLTELIFFRLLQGVGGGLLAPITMAMVYRLVPRERIGTAMGIYGLTIAFGPALGPTLGGYLVQYVDWRLIFYINVPVGILGVVLATAVLPPFAGDSRKPFDVWGFVTSALGLGLLLYGLTEGQTWGWTSEASVLVLMGAAWMLALYVAIELTAPHPLLDLRIFRYRVFSLSSVLVVVTVVALYAGSFYVPLYMQEVQGYGAFATGLTLMPGALVMGATMPFSGRLYDAVGARVPAVIGMLVVGGATLLFLSMTAYTTNTTIALWMALRSLGLAMAMMPVMTAGLSVIPTAEIGRASAINNLIQRTAGSLGLAVLTSVYSTDYAQQAANLANHVTLTSPGLATLMQQTAAVVSRAVQPFVAKDSGLLVIAQAISDRAFTAAMHDVFGYAAISAVIGAGLAIFLREQRHGGGRGRPGVSVE